MVDDLRMAVVFKTLFVCYVCFSTIFFTFKDVSYDSDNFVSSSLY
jgi:hypothetical protein